MPLRLTPAFAVKKGFRTNPANWAKLREILTFSGPGAEVLKTRVIATLLFGNRYEKIFRAAYEHISILGGPPQENSHVLHLIILLGARRLREFLHEMLGDDFSTDVSPPPEIANGRLLPGDAKHFLAAAGRPPHFYPFYFRGGIVEGLHFPEFSIPWTAKPREAAHYLVDYVDDLIGGPGGHLVSLCMWLVYTMGGCELAKAAMLDRMALDCDPCPAQNSPMC